MLYIDGFEVVSAQGGEVYWAMLIMLFLIFLLGLFMVFASVKEGIVERDFKGWIMPFLVGVLFCSFFIYGLFETPKTEIKYNILLKENQTIDALEWTVVKAKGDLVTIVKRK